MRKTVILAVAVISVWMAATRTMASQPIGRVGRPAVDGVSQAIVTYGFLRSRYADFDQLLTSGSVPAFSSDVRTLEGALDSLQCDILIRMAFPHRAIVVPTLPVGQWIEDVRAGDVVPREGLLFVTQFFRRTPERTLVLLSSVAPERTTVFWLDRDSAAELVYDSFNKGAVANAPDTRVGSVIAVRLGRSNEVFLRESAEPGSRPRASGAVGRVFQMDLERVRVLLKSPGRPPQQ